MKSLKLVLIAFFLVFLVSCQTNTINDNIINQNTIKDNVNDVLRQKITTTLENEDDQDYSKKMSPDLLSIVNDLNDDDIISVYVFLSQIDYDEVSARLLSLGIDESIYRDEERFLEYINQLYGNDSEQISAEQERYRTLRLQVIKEITLGANQDFIDLYEIDEDQILYLSSLTTTLIIKVPVYTLKLIALDNNVVDLSQYIELILTND